MSISKNVYPAAINSATQLEGVCVLRAYIRTVRVVEIWGLFRANCITLRWDLTHGYH